MNAFVEKCNKIFGETTLHYHKFDNIDAVPENPYEAGTIDDVLFRKNWIDAVQWHMEDIIRDPAINPVEALALKRRIDKSNQDRTDLVEDSTPISATFTATSSRLTAPQSTPKVRHGQSTVCLFSH